jgi:hypothetical protein
VRNVSGTILIVSLYIVQTATQLITGQQSGHLKVSVLNSGTNEPLQFAEIRLKKIQLKVYSNADGKFSLNNNPELKSDSLIITKIGYKKFSVAVKDLNDMRINKIYLDPAQLIKETVKVAPENEKINSVAILRRAIGNISNRYPFKPFSFISYYRDYLKSDSNYINLNEAIIQVIDSGFTSRSSSNIYRILDFRRSADFSRLNLSPALNIPDSMDLKFNDGLIQESLKNNQYGKEFVTIMAHDPIRNFNTRSFSFIENFSQDFINNHNFSPPSRVYNDNLLLFRITFNGKSRIIGDSLLVSGAIYIHQHDYSIHKLEYSCYDNTKGKGLKKIFDVNLEYGYDNETDSMMRLEYISISRLYNVVNMDDSSYFRLIDYRWDNFSYIYPTLALSFNNKIDPLTATQKENYIIMVGENKIKIHTIQVVGKNIFIRFKDEDLKGMEDSFEVYFRGSLKDIHGNSLDKRKSMEIYQYRELFVEKYNPSVIKDSTNVQYLFPVKDSLTSNGVSSQYWMNTPENILKLPPDSLLLIPR